MYFRNRRFRMHSQQRRRRDDNRLRDLQRIACFPGGGNVAVLVPGKTYVEVFVNGDAVRVYNRSGVADIDDSFQSKHLLVRAVLFDRLFVHILNSF